MKGENLVTRNYRVEEEETMAICQSKAITETIIVRRQRLMSLVLFSSVYIR